MPTYALTHSENRFKVCLMCPDVKPPAKNPNKAIGEIDAARIVEHFISNFDRDNQKLPQSLCSKHRYQLFDFDRKTKAGQKVKALPDPVDFSKLDFGGLTDRQLKDCRDCNCSFCSVARANVGNSPKLWTTVEKVENLSVFVCL